MPATHDTALPAGPNGPHPIRLGPKSLAGIERAGLEVLHRRHPSIRFEVVRDEQPAACSDGLADADGSCR